ncbi:hypothetical protein [Lacipirellula parvula]|uniref:Uncharacterized protein n=1 Tax=Lacipirellula parvula TaxID=2650471 RepID=A0A5K7X398_9BACT|nr:hypothetical protein [Lacipirellula parvula]BBO30835.1 hypothetical protein PLANPX_0447 [Lacipirellula parvula]
MGIQRDNGYSATVQAFLAVGESMIRLAKTGRTTLTFAEACELPPGTEGELVVCVDGHRDTRGVVLLDGLTLGQRVAAYAVTAPF